MVKLNLGRVNAGKDNHLSEALNSGENIDPIVALIPLMGHRIQIKKVNEHNFFSNFSY